MKSRPCNICGTHNGGHSKTCEAKAIRNLQDENIKYDCPECSEGYIGMNSNNLFECRVCKTQFTTDIMNYTGNPEYTFISKYDESLIYVRVLPNKGHGIFPIEEKIKELRKIVRSINSENESLFDW